MNSEQPEGAQGQSGQDKIHYCANCGLPMTGEFSTWDTGEGEPVCHMYLRDCIQVLQQQIAADRAQVALGDALYEAVVDYSIKPNAYRTGQVKLALQAYKARRVGGGEEGEG